MTDWTTRIVFAGPDGQLPAPELSGLGDVIHISFAETRLPTYDLLVLVDPPLDWLERIHLERVTGTVSLLAMSSPTAQHIRVGLNRLGVDAICDIDAIYIEVERLRSQLWTARAKQALLSLEQESQ